MQLAMLFLLTTLIHLVGTGSYAARLAGVRTGQPALVSSLYSALALSARGANALVNPLVASITDLAVTGGNVQPLLTTYRVQMLAATAGTLVAAQLIPSLSRILAAGVASYEKRRSLPRVIVRGATVRGLWRIQQSLAQPRISTFVEARKSPFPKRFLLASILVTALATVGSAAALYASTLVPQGARTAPSLSPLFTGIGAMLSIMWIDPVAAFVSDRALRGEQPLKTVTYITVWQVGARFVGTLLAQALFLPLSWAIAALTRLLV